MSRAAKPFQRLFSEGRIGPLRLRNRIISSPMEKNLAKPDGSVTQRCLINIRERARGGAALICPETLYIAHRGKGNHYQLGIHDDAMISGLKRLCDVIHGEGALAAAEISHAGRQALYAATGLQPVAPSPLPFIGFRRGDVPKELSAGGIRDSIQAFAAAAVRARKAGFDAIMIHGAHGYLIHQFFSPRSNKRTDEYGGSLENRLRFPLQVVGAIRNALGDAFPLLYRLSAYEGMEDGLVFEDVCALCRALEESGVHHVDVSAGTYESSSLITPSMEAPIALNVDMAGEIKNRIGISVSVVGRIMDPESAEQILRSGKADFVTMGRALHADPNLPRKTQEGRLEEIRPCVSCLKCSDLLGTGEPVLCMTNSHAGQEAETAIRRAVAAKRVLVVGGGPAGLEAARVAALRGHQVSLFEMSGQLGGQVLYASKAPGRGDLILLVDSLASEVRRLGVEVCLWTRVDVDEVRRYEPEEIILATGALAGPPSFPSIPASALLDPLDAMANGWDGEGRVLVFGGGMCGCAVAGRLAELGGEVMVLESGEALAGDLGLRARFPMVQKLTSWENVKIFLNTSLEQFEGDRAVLRGKDGGVSAIGGIRLIVPARVTSPQDELHTTLAEKIPGLRVQVVGDCRRPRGIFEAVQEGAAAARSI